MSKCNEKALKKQRIVKGQWRSVKWWQRDVKERWKGVKGRKSVKSDVDALKFNGEALIGATDAVNGDAKGLKGDE